MVGKKKGKKYQLAGCPAGCGFKPTTTHRGCMLSPKINNMWSLGDKFVIFDKKLKKHGSLGDSKNLKGSLGEE